MCRKSLHAEEAEGQGRLIGGMRMLYSSEVKVIFGLTLHHIGNQIYARLV